MPPEQVSMGCSEAPCRADEVPFLGAEYDSANKPRRPGPTHYSNNSDDQKESSKWAYGQRQESAYREKDVQPRQRHKKLGKAHEQDRKSTRLNSSHVSISYAVF